MTITLNGTTGITTPAVTNNGAYTGDGVVFADGTPSNTLVTNTSGYVGVGTASPSAPIDVVSNSSALGLLVRGRSSDDIGKMNFSNNANSTTYATIQAYSGEFSIQGVANAPTVFYTNNTERMRINGNGDVFINSTNYPVVGIEKFGVNGNTTIAGAFSTSSASNPTVFINNSTTGTVTLVRFSSGTGGNTVGNITANGSNTTYSTSSDYRLKENIAPMTGALAKLSALKPCTYTWKNTGEQGEGFIAHELAEVVPDCVVGEKDATEVVDIKDEEGNVIGQETKPVYQGIDTSYLVATLTAAIQELKAELDTVKTELATLKGTA